ncbi:MAG TPA: hypothetical protein PL048_22140, partial [Leptospiraceae bacterium]|nr:hypothetical protein [Leptospiraceae bacterium]
LHRKLFYAGLMDFEKTGHADKTIILDRLVVQGESKDSLLKVFQSLKGEVLSYYQFELYCKTLKHKSKLRALMKACEYLQNKAREEIFQVFG